MNVMGAMLLAFGLLFIAIWLIWWMGICDAVSLQIAGNCSGNGTHIFTRNAGESPGLQSWDESVRP